MFSQRPIIIVQNYLKASTIRSTYLYIIVYLIRFQVGFLL